MPPITFQNVTPVNNAGLFRGFDAVGKSLQRGLTNFQDVIGQRQAANQGVLDRADAEGTLAFKQLLGSARTAEEVEALSPQLDQIAGGLSTGAQSALLNSAPEQVAALQQRFTEQANFETANLNRAQAEGRRGISEELFQAGAEEQLAGIETAGLDRQFAESQRKGLQTLQGKETSNALEDQNILTAASDAAGQYKQAKQAEGQNLGTLARGFGFPVNAAGLPDVANMSSDQIKQLNIARASQEEIGTVDPNNIPNYVNRSLSGDTADAGAFREFLGGQFSQEAINRNSAAINSAFDTSKTGQLIGIDKLNAEKAAAQQEVALRERESANKYTPGSKDAANAYEELSKDVTALFKDVGTFGANDVEDLPDVQKLLGKLSRQGIEITDADGETSFVTPSRDDVIDAIRSTAGFGVTDFARGLSDSQRADDIEEHLIENLGSEFTTDKLIEAEQDAVLRREANVRSILGR